jgi:hypothetical protein
MLADHNFTIVQVDGGSYVKPLEVDHLELGTGQRYAALLTTKSIEDINALGRTVFWANVSSFYRATVDTGYALLRYNLEDETSPGLPSEAFQAGEPSNSAIPKTPNSTFGWIDSQLEPLISDPYPEVVDQSITPRLY